jgi:hypothetical protein
LSPRNLDIRDAILQLLNVIREGNKKLIQHDKTEGEISNQVPEASFLRNP